MTIDFTGESVITQYEVFGYTQNARKDAVYKNKVVPILLDVPDDYVLRRMRAKQVQNQELGDRYEKFFTSLPSEYPRGEKKDYTHFDGVILPKVAEPKSWEDFDLFTSKASHYEVYCVGNKARPEKWPDPNIPLFDLAYVQDKASKNRLLIADFRRTSDGFEINPQIEAVLKILKPSYYFMRQGNQTLFAANKFVGNSK